MTAQVSKQSLRGLRYRERMEKLRAAAPIGIRVVPANDDMRRLLKHPRVGGFRQEGSMEWPDDRFTKRRLADGSIKREQPPPEAKPKHQHRSESNSAA